MISLVLPKPLRGRCRSLLLSRHSNLGDGGCRRFSSNRSGFETGPAGPADTTPAGKGMQRSTDHPSFLLDKTGRVVAVHVRGAQLEARVKQALGLGAGPTWL